MTLLQFSAPCRTMAPYPMAPCNVTMTPYPMALCKKGQIVNFFQIRFILCWSFWKGSIIAIFTWEGRARIPS
jgi:hypothetical protein